MRRGWFRFAYVHGQQRAIAMLLGFSRSWMSPRIIFARQQALEACMSKSKKLAISLRETNPYVNKAGID